MHLELALQSYDVLRLQPLAQATPEHAAQLAVSLVGGARTAIDRLMQHDATGASQQPAAAALAALQPFVARAEAFQAAKPFADLVERLQLRRSGTYFQLGPAFSESVRQAREVVDDLARLMRAVRPISRSAARELENAAQLLKASVDAGQAPDAPTSARAAEWVGAANVRLRERAASALTGSTQMAHIASLLEPVRDKLNSVHARQLLAAATHPRSLTAQEVGRLRAAADALNTLRFNPPANATTRDDVAAWRLALEGARLEIARTMSAIAHRDLLPPAPANLASSRLLRASALLLEHADPRFVSVAATDSRGRHLLMSLLMAAHAHQRWTAHLGKPAAQLLPIVYDEQETSSFATVFMGAMGGSSHLRVGGAALHVPNMAVMAHESVHMAQNNARRMPQWGGSVGPRRPDDPLPPSRVGHLETSVSLRPGDAAPPTPTGASSDVQEFVAALSYVNNPREIQAFMEGAAVHRLGDRDAAGAFPPSLFPLPAWSRLAALLTEAASTLQAPVADGAFLFDASVHPEAAGHAERILHATARLHDARASKAWSAGHDTDLFRVMDGLARAQANDPAASGTVRLAAIASQLVDFADRVAYAAGDAIHSPAGVDAAPQRFAEASRAPGATLVSLVGAEARRVLRRELRGIETLPDALAASKRDSGFTTAVRQIVSKHAQGVVPTPAEVGDAVMRLSASLLGVPLETVPEILAPEVNLYRAPSMQLWHVPGLNVAPGQRRKAVFEAASWQLHVPLQILSEPAKLESRLAGMAAEVAYATVALRMLRAEPERARAALGLDLPMSWLASIAEAAERVLAPFDRAVKPPPALALRLLLHELPPLATDSQWHLGERAAVKANAASDPVSREAYEARSLQRWQLQSVAWRRAVVAAGAQEAASSA